MYEFTIVLLLGFTPDSARIEAPFFTVSQDEITAYTQCVSEAHEKAIEVQKEYNYERIIIGTCIKKEPTNV